MHKVIRLATDLTKHRRHLYASHNPRRGDRVVVAMSGGVDSSVTAHLLANQDFDLSAIFMRNWDTRDESGTDIGCEWEKDWEDVQKVCNMLDIPCKMIDLSRDYWNRVFEPSLQTWEKGDTPNPDISCNREIKFGSLVDRLGFTGMQWLATGHYAGIESDFVGERLRAKLVRASDRRKDQTYYLSAVSEFQLQRTLFPLSTLTKTCVREIAKRSGLPTASRIESMGICFVGEKRNFNDFLGRYLLPKPGPIMNMETGQKVGDHEGLWRFTIGQGAKIPGMKERMFVARKETLSNTVVVVPGSNHPALYCRGLLITQFNWIWNDTFPDVMDEGGSFQASVQFRHRMLDVPCVVKTFNERTEIWFSEEQKAVAPGQLAAIYLRNWCLGCGVIEDTFT